MTTTLLPLIAVFLSAQLGGGTQPESLHTKMQAPRNCGQCHGLDSRPTSLLPNQQYRGSMMSLASVDPFYLAAIDIAYKSSPAGTELCFKCHIPIAWLDGRGQPSDASEVYDDDLAGVSCDVCHRAVIPPPARDDARRQSPLSDDPFPLRDDGDVDWSGYLVGNSQITYSDSTTQFGPNGGTAPTHASRVSPLVGDGRMCGACHDVTNPLLNRLDLNGIDTGRPMPLERTFSEWRQSRFAQGEQETCQKCHMHKAMGKAAISNGAPERELGLHRIVGGSTVAPKMVAHLYNRGSVRDLRNLDADADAAVAASRQLLQEESATLEVSPEPLPASPRQLSVRITNLSGHKLPTGYAEGRRMFLGHQVTYADGVPGPRSGTFDANTWNFVKGQEPAHTWEIHLGIGGDVSFHFIDVNTVLSDNRIPPEGFVPSIDTAPVGHSFEKLEGGVLANWDDISLPLGEPTRWPARVQVTLGYQSISGDYYHFLLDNASPERATALRESWEAVGGSLPETMRTLDLQVEEDGTVSPWEGPSLDIAGCRHVNAPLHSPPLLAFLVSLISLVGLGFSRRERPLFTPPDSRVFLILCVMNVGLLSGTLGGLLSGCGPSEADPLPAAPQVEGPVCQTASDVVVMATDPVDATTPLSLETRLATVNGGDRFGISVGVDVYGVDPTADRQELSIFVYGVPRTPEYPRNGDDGQTCIAEGGAMLCNGDLRCVGTHCRVILGRLVTTDGLEMTCGDDGLLHLAPKSVALFPQFTEADLDGYQVDLQVGLKEGTRPVHVGHTYATLQVQAPSALDFSTTSDAPGR